tara:strand:+ start:1529 stop:1738 length:210 start_codon:yes stop_codon:yes gene_type:complete
MTIINQSPPPTPPPTPPHTNRGRGSSELSGIRDRRPALSDTSRGRRDSSPDISDIFIEITPFPDILSPI